MKKIKSTQAYLLLIAILGVSSITGCLLPGGGSAPVNPGTAGNYVILAKTAIANVI